MTFSSDASAASLPSAGVAVTLDASEIQTVASNEADNTVAADTEEEVELKLSAGEASIDPMVASVQSDENGEVGSYATIVPSVDTRITEIKDAQQFANLVIAKCNDYVNVRQEPSEESEILGKLYNESVGEFVSEADGGWYEISSGSVTGYVKAEYVVTGDEAVELAKQVGKRIATVNTTTLFVREEATTDSSVIGMVPIEDELSVTEEEGLDGWVKVSIEEGEGYVSTDYVELSTEFVKAESKAEEEARLAKEEAERKQANAAVSKSGKSSGSASVSSSGSGAGSSVASFACQFVGNPYVYGGSSLTNGTDCSGFVMSVYANFGVSLPHSSGALRGCGYDVGGIGNAQPGDIVCYSGHVGIYIGGGQIVHASTAATGIKISNANYREILSVRRIF
jgi:cell wall-associated NlpC family hydrolase